MYPSLLFGVIRHFLFLRLASEDGVGHRLQAIQLLHYLLSAGLLAQTSFGLATEVLLLVVSLPGSGVEREIGGVIGRFDFIGGNAR